MNNFNIIASQYKKELADSIPPLRLKESQDKDYSQPIPYSLPPDAGKRH